MRQILIFLLFISVANAQDIRAKSQIQIDIEKAAAEQRKRDAAGPDPRYGTYGDRIPPITESKELFGAERERQSEQRAKYSQMHRANGNRAYLWLFINYDLSVELDLSKDQLDALSRISLPSPFSAKQEILWGKTFPVSDAVFKDFVKRFPGEYRRGIDKADRAVEEILDESQLARLKQIYFQLNVFIYPDLGVALRTHGESLPRKESVVIAGELKLLRRRRGIDKSLTHSVIWKETLSSVYGKQKVKEWTGELFGDADRDLREKVSKLLKEETKTPAKTGSTRRKR